jgi:HlyD family secretion protein
MHDGGTPAQPDPDVERKLGLGHRTSPLLRAAQVIAGLALLGGLGYAGQRYVAQRAVNKRPSYELATAKRADIDLVVSATGTVKGLSTVEVGAEVTGKILKVHVGWNDAVTAGQVIAELDPEQLQAAVSEAEARVREADAQIRQSEATRRETTQAKARAEVQAGQGLIAKSELESIMAAAERAEANLLSARASATLARAALDSSRSRLAKTKILSPINGVVLTRLMEPGQTVTAGFQTPILFKLAEDLKRMSLHVFIDEADIGRVREGQSASFTVDAYPGKVFPSKVRELRNEPKSEQNVVTYEAVLTVDNEDMLLRPGMTATASIVAGRHASVLTVPSAALRFTPPIAAKGAFSGGPEKTAQLNKPTGKRKLYVLKPSEEGPKPSAVEVVTGVSDGTLTEIVSGGVREGTEVIVDAVEKPE